VSVNTCYSVVSVSVIMLSVNSQYCVQVAASEGEAGRLQCGRWRQQPQAKLYYMAQCTRSTQHSSQHTAVCRTPGTERVALRPAGLLLSSGILPNMPRPVSQLLALKVKQLSSRAGLEWAGGMAMGLGGSLF
jgi:hypothetical protein